MLYSLAMSYLLRRDDVIAHFGNNRAAVGRAFVPIIGRALTKAAVRQWPELVPPLRARELVEQYPELRELLLDPVTRLTRREMRDRLAAGAQPS